MNLTVTYAHDIDSIVIKATGRIGCREIISLKDEILNHPDFRPNINQLFDCSEGQLDLSTDDLEQIASSYMQSAEQLGQKRRLALLVARDLDFGMMRQYVVFFDSGPGVSVRVFRSLPEAETWLIKG